MSCKATIPVEMEVEAHFLAKEDGILAGVALAEMVFTEVDPSLKVMKGEFICRFFLLRIHVLVRTKNE